MPSTFSSFSTNFWSGLESFDSSRFESFEDPDSFLYYTAVCTNLSYNT